MASEDVGAVAGGHSIRYLAEKARRQQEREKKRKERELEVQHDERVEKKVRLEANKKAMEDVEALKRRALCSLEQQLAASASEELAEGDVNRLIVAQKAAADRNRLMKEHEAKREAVRGLRLDAGGIAFADDWDNRVMA